METTDDAASISRALAEQQPRGSLPSGTTDHAALAAEAKETTTELQSVALSELKDRWDLYGKFPVDLSVSFPLEEITLGHLAGLRPGMVLKSAWPAAEDVPLSTGEVFLANVSFEPVGTRLGVRLSGFAPRPAPSSKRPTRLQMPEMDGQSEPNQQDVSQKQTLDTLNDLWLSLSVCVGTAQLPLGELLQWAAGDTIPLDRAVNAPVNLLLKERIVAGGNLVLVGGFYAVQLTEIAPRSRRLPSC
jgi:flagellar motor switch protein FliN/FliY